MNESISSVVNHAFPPHVGLPVHPEPLAIRCAECLHCKLFKETNRDGRYVLKCRCSKKHWYRGKKEVTVGLHLVGARKKDVCPDYESTSDDDIDRAQYIESLEELLPIERHIYNADGSFVDKTETMRWPSNT